MEVTDILDFSNISKKKHCTLINLCAIFNKSLSDRELKIYKYGKLYIFTIDRLKAEELMSYEFLYKFLQILRICVIQKKSANFAIENENYNH